MKTTTMFPRVSVSVERPSIDVAMMSPTKVPDPNWRYVDKAGHGHFWQGNELPTLEWVVTGTQVAGDEYEMYEYEVGEHRCQLCAEVIDPGKKLDYGPTTVPGPPEITVSIDGEEFLLNEEQFANSVEDWRAALREIVRR